MNDRIVIDIADHVANVRMIRVDKMNALDHAMFGALDEAGKALRGRKDVRSIVLSGDGRGFCAGLDLQTFRDMAEGEASIGDLTGPRSGVPNPAQHVVMQWRAMPVPVIAAVHGVAFGGGFQLTLGADMRFVHPETKLSIMEIKWGLVPDMGGMWLLRDLVRPDIAADLTYSGRIFSGEEAVSLGLATRTCEDPLAAALEYARQIAQKSPDAVRAAKRLLSIHDEEMATRVFTAEAVEQGALISSPNQMEAVRSVEERRAPNFVD
jgi:enoyl-CoA hydratase/carnithine racemase